MEGLAGIECVQVLLLGLVLGSFANVCVHRWPRGQSIIRPPSHCPACDSHIRWFDNVPVLSFLLLRGRCRRCGVPIPRWYPLNECLMAACLLALWGQFGLGWDFFSLTVLCFGLLVAAAVDLQHGIIPNIVSFGGAAAGVALAWLAPGDTILTAIIGLLVAATVMAGIRVMASRFFQRESMGLGDVKLVGMMGAFLGWPGALIACYLGFVAALLFLGPRYLLQRKPPEQKVRMGPFLAVGGLISALFGNVLVDWILR